MSAPYISYAELRLAQPPEQNAQCCCYSVGWISIVCTTILSVVRSAELQAARSSVFENERLPMLLIRLPGVQYFRMNVCCCCFSAGCQISVFQNERLLLLFPAVSPFARPQPQQANGLCTAQLVAAVGRRIVLRPLGAFLMQANAPTHQRRGGCLQLAQTRRL